MVPRARDLSGTYEYYSVVRKRYSVIWGRVPAAVPAGAGNGAALQLAGDTAKRQGWPWCGVGVQLVGHVAPPTAAGAAAKTGAVVRSAGARATSSAGRSKQAAQLAGDAAKRRDDHGLGWARVGVQLVVVGHVAAAAPAAA